ncbi:unnamed protein product (macronuclear) [Paramecium tetraurelia]|uniref:Transmembrane protein n=1 Tax=Paramecium tetraurelia TaxID=5888 RepID=A0EHD2_PARTE|nr:uncharacterized protein GSPATT00027047001 [Paramecium tetraurelia]CAK94723.1 unnamed protein product [Paramecium tetraurelia]|eukprot:XP_001462096.1 hypothetical protein (macronuclear) [Paramecium tetraurelia strain d4-2]
MNLIEINLIQIEILILTYLNVASSQEIYFYPLLFIQENHESQIHNQFLNLFQSVTNLLLSQDINLNQEKQVENNQFYEFDSSYFIGNDCLNNFRCSLKFQIFLQCYSRIFLRIQQLLQKLLHSMGSKPCCCESPKNQFSEINIIIQQISQEVRLPTKNPPQKPVPLQMMKSLKQEDDFGFFLVMEQYERLLRKKNHRIRSASPNQQIQTETKEFTTTQNLKKHQGKLDYQKSRSFSNTKISTSSQKSTIKSILKKRSTQNQISYKQEKSFTHRSFKFVHFDQAVSSKNAIFLRAYN